MELFIFCLKITQVVFRGPQWNLEEFLDFLVGNHQFCLASVKLCCKLTPSPNRLLS